MKKPQDGPSAKDIIYFEIPDAQKSQNIVKNYLSYLKFSKLKGPYRFCYVQSDYELIESMTLRENLYLDTIPLSLTQSRDNQFKGHMQGQTNKHLLKLLNGIDSLDSFPSRTDQRSRKILGLSKALMQDVEFLFLDAPEKHLSAADLELFIQALHFHVGLHKKTVLLSSKHENLWLHHATKRVQRDSEQNFKTEELNEKCLQQYFLRSNTAEQDQLEQGLKIHLGHWQDKKAA